VQHRKEELLSIRHENPSTQRLQNEAEAHQVRPGFGFTAGNNKFHINSISIQFTLSIFLDFFLNEIIDDKSKDGAL